MKRSSERERDVPFGQTMRALRIALGLTQRGLAEHLGVSRQTVEKWEAGLRYPKVASLKQLIELGVQRQIFSVGSQRKEIRALWQVAHQKERLDESWLQAVLGQKRSPLTLMASQRVVQVRSSSEQAPTPPIQGLRADWGEAPATLSFYGREQEVTLLCQWVLQEHCRLVNVLGMGGIGKSALAVNVMEQLASHFEVVIFRSLRDAPSCKMLLDDCLQVLSPQPLLIVPANLERRLRQLIESLQRVRALIVLDNLEALLEEREATGRFRPGFEDYARLLRRVGEASHQSCLLLTSREKPADVELRRLEGEYAPVRSLRLGGLSIAACERMFAEQELVGTPQEQAYLAEVYAGNPLALKIVAQTITELFMGKIGQFLSGGIVIFGSITRLLDEQFSRLSPLEQTVLCWLAIIREHVTLNELRAVLITPLPQRQLLEAIESLRRRSLLERGQRPASFTLQAVVLEYMTTVLVKQVTHEIQHCHLQRLIQYGLERAHARVYVRQAQEQLLLAPILVNLRSAHRGRGEVEELLLSRLDQLREQADAAQGYGPANLIALLRLQRGHLRSLDLSHLCLREAYLQGVEMQDASLVGTLMQDTVLTQAFDAIWSVAISRSGEFWAAGSWRGEVRVWREAGRCLHLAWQAHTDTTSTLSFSPDESTLATGGWDGTVKLWDLQSGALLWTRRHTDLTLSVVFAPDGHTLASSGNDALIHLWETSSGKQVRTLTSQGGAVYTLAWSPDGRLLASGSCDGNIVLWHLQADQPATSVKRLVGHTNWAHSLAFAPDGTQLVSGSWDSTVKLWDIASGCVWQTLTGHTQRVDVVAWSPDGGTVASASSDGTIRLWEVAQSRYRAVLQGHTSAVYSLAFMPDSRSLLSGSEDNTLRVWDVTSGQCLHTIEGYAVCFYDLAWSPDGSLLASGSTDGLVTLWEVTGRTRPRGLRGHHWIVSGVAWSPDGRLLASSGWDNAIRLWEPTMGACLQVLQGLDAGGTQFSGIAWSPDGRLLACGSYLQGVQVWEMSTGRRCWVGQQNQTTVRRVVWSPDGTWLLSGGDDGSICLWKACDGKLIERLQGHRGMVASVAWSPDGVWLVSGGSGGLFVWEVHSGKPMRTFADHPGVASAVAWDSSGERLISGGSDGKLRWWEVQSGECVQARAGHQGAIQALKASPDGGMLASCGNDGAILIWDLHRAELVRTLRRDRPYERLNITGIRGLTEAQKATLRVLGAIEGVAVSQTSPDDL